MRDDTAMNNFLNTLPGWLIELRKMQEAKAESKAQRETQASQFREQMQFGRDQAATSSKQFTQELEQRESLADMQRALQELQIKTGAGEAAGGRVPDIVDGNLIYPDQPSYEPTSIQATKLGRMPMDTPQQRLEDKIATATGKQVDVANSVRDFGLTGNESIEELNPKISGLADLLSKAPPGTHLSSAQFETLNKAISSAEKQYKSGGKLREAFRGEGALIEPERWKKFVKTGQLFGKTSRGEERRSLGKLMDEINKNYELIQLIHQPTK